MRSERWLPASIAAFWAISKQALACAYRVHAQILLSKSSLSLSLHARAGPRDYELHFNCIFNGRCCSSVARQSRLAVSSSCSRRTSQPHHKWNSNMKSPSRKILTCVATGWRCVAMRGIFAELRQLHFHSVSMIFGGIYVLLLSRMYALLQIS